MRNLDFKGKFLQITESDGYLTSYEVEEIRPNRNKSGVIIMHETGQLELLAIDCGVAGVPFDDFDDLNDWLNSKLVASSVAANFGTTSDNQAASDTGTFTFMSLFKRLLVKLTSGLIVSGKLVKRTDSFTTAIGATAYAVGDVINNTGAASLRYIDVGCNSGYLVGLSLEFDNAAPLSTPNPLPTIRIRFFDASDNSLAIADNAPDEVLFINNVRRLGHIDLPIMTLDGNRLVAADENIRFPFANLTGGLLYYKIINQVGTPTLSNAGLGRGVFIRAKVDQNPA